MPYTAHAAINGYNSVLIRSDDTDLYVICLAYDADIHAKFFFRNVAPKHVQNSWAWRKIAKSVGTSVCLVLIGMRVYTGCDTVITFAKRGKQSALKLISINTDA